MHLYFLSGPRQEFGNLGLNIIGKTRMLCAEFLKWNLPGKELDYSILLTIDNWLNKAINSP